VGVGEMNRLLVALGATLVVAGLLWPWHRLAGKPVLMWEGWANLHFWTNASNSSEVRPSFGAASWFSDHANRVAAVQPTITYYP